jgi:hypothetical protein
MYQIKKCFLFLFFIISALYIGFNLFLEDSSQDIILMVFALNNNFLFTSSHPIITVQDLQTSDEFTDKSTSKLVQKIAEKDTCPPKPTSLERDPRTKSLEPDADPGPPIRINVPTLANTGSILIIEGTGFIPLEEVRVELLVDWVSSSPDLKNKTFFQCKIVQADNLGSFSTILQLPEMPLDTTSIGKYSIIGMESRQEETKSG